jgi:hypothetical protein
MQKFLEQKTQKPVALVEAIDIILSRKWMGKPEERDSPFHNLKKIFNYDVDRNSGFYKKWHETFRDTIIDKTAEWTVAPIITGLIGALIGALFVTVFKINP